MSTTADITACKLCVFRVSREACRQLTVECRLCIFACRRKLRLRIDLISEPPGPAVWKTRERAQDRGRVACRKHRMHAWTVSKPVRRFEIIIVSCVHSAACLNQAFFLCGRRETRSQDAEKILQTASTTATDSGLRFRKFITMALTRGGWEQISMTPNESIGRMPKRRLRTPQTQGKVPCRAALKPTRTNFPITNPIPPPLHHGNPR